jgi:DNA-binding transcriptional regulator YiaG
MFGTEANTVTYWETNRSEPSLRLVPGIIAFPGYVPLCILPQEPGKRIAVCRKLAGFSREEPAKRLGIDPDTLRKWEKGRGLHSGLYEKVAAFLIQALHGIDEAKTQIFRSYAKK